MRLALAPLDARGPRAAVLMYHRVAAPERDPLGLSVSPTRFAEQLEVLRREFHPLPLSELADRVRCGDVSSRSVAVTFDDGYADNLHQARPALEAAGVPASVFVASGWTGAQREMPWDEVERLLLGPGQRPETLELRIGRRSLRTPTATPVQRQAAHRAILARMRVAGPRAIGDALEALRTWADEPPAGAHRATHRMLNEEEVRSLDGGLVTIGAHTVSHPSLARLPKKSQREELRRSREALEGLLGRRVTELAYPYGLAGLDWTRATRDAAEAAGFSVAVAVRHRAVTRHSHPLSLPRTAAHDWDGDRLTAWVRRLTG